MAIVALQEETQVCGHCRAAKPLGSYPQSYRGRKGTWCRDCSRTRYTPRPKRPEPATPAGYAYCFKCEQARPEAEFYKRPDGSTRRHCKHCKDCIREWHRKRYVPKHGADDAPRDCEQCGESYRPKARRLSRFCSRVCAEKARVASGRRRETYLQRRYGMSTSEYERLLTKQGGGCALCGKKPEEQQRYSQFLHVDHCHDTGRVRGLLCDQHNLLIGRWNHDPVLLRRAATYLEESEPANGLHQ